MVLIIFAVVALFIVIAIIGNVQTRKRREALEAWAAGHGFSFDTAQRRGVDEQYPWFGCLRRGTNRYAYNVIRGARHGRSVAAFDYHYETHSNDSKGKRQTHHHHFSAVILDTALPLKPLSIRAETFFDKLTEFLGFDDIDFESREFSRAFYVKAPDKRWAYDVIHQETMEFLLGQPRFSIEFAERFVLAHRDRALDAPGFEQALGLIEGLIDRLPPSLLRELREEAGTPA